MVPAVMVVAPPKVLALESVSVPAPVLVRARLAPVRVPAKLSAAASFTVKVAATPV